jgi:hypothetical protein
MSDRNVPEEEEVVEPPVEEALPAPAEPVAPVEGRVTHTSKTEAEELAEAEAKANAPVVERRDDEVEEDDEEEKC